jgi:hypothetical protein
MENNLDNIIFIIIMILYAILIIGGIIIIDLKINKEI